MHRRNNHSTVHEVSTHNMTYKVQAKRGSSTWCILAPIILFILQSYCSLDGLTRRLCRWKAGGRHVMRYPLSLYFRPALSRVPCHVCLSIRGLYSLNFSKDLTDRNEFDREKIHIERQMHNRMGTVASKMALLSLRYSLSFPRHFAVPRRARNGRKWLDVN